MPALASSYIATFARTVVRFPQAGDDALDGVDIKAKLQQVVAISLCCNAVSLLLGTIELSVVAAVKSVELN